MREQTFPRHDNISLHINQQTSDELAGLVYSLANKVPGLCLPGQLKLMCEAMQQIIDKNNNIAYSFNRIINNESDALYITGLPTFEGPGSPGLYRVMALTLGSLTGEPFQYKQQHGGELVPALIPDHGSELKHTHAAAAHFGPHTDDAYIPHKYRTKLISLLGQVNEGNAETGYSSISKIMDILSEAQINLLKKPLFRFKKPFSFEPSSEHSVWSEPQPILFDLADGKMGVQSPTYNTEVIAGNVDTASAHDAFGAFCAAVDEKMEWFVVGQGSYLIFRNDRGLHARRAIKDGLARCVYRTYWHGDLGPMSFAGCGGNVYDLDVLLEGEA